MRSSAATSTRNSSSGKQDCSRNRGRVRIDVHFSGNTAAQQHDLHDRVVLVVDVLRASTSIAAAMHNGARAVIPFEGVDEAITRARSLERSDVLLAGERKMA